MVKSPKASAPTQATPFLLPDDTVLLTSMALLEARKPLAGNNLVVSRAYPELPAQLLASVFQPTKLPLGAECIEHEDGSPYGHESFTENSGLLLCSLPTCPERKPPSAWWLSSHLRQAHPCSLAASAHLSFPGEMMGTWKSIPAQLLFLCERQRKAFP